MESGVTDELAAWWESSDVLEARERSGYDEGAPLTVLLSELLDVVDEREAEVSSFPDCPVSTAFKLAARDFSQGTVVTRAYANGAITQLLDLGAEPDKIKASGAFDPVEVDRVAAKWRSWRGEVVTAARRGASSDEIRALVPTRVAWHPIVVDVLAAHGFTLDEPADRRRTAGALQLQVMELWGGGMATGKIAAEAGCSRQNVNNIVRNVRAGRHPEYMIYLTQRAA